MKFIIIVGLPASGKSFLANEIAQKTPGSLVIDDPNDDSFLDNLEAELIIITHPIFCKLYSRQLLIDSIEKKNENPEIEWIFFENDKKTCLLNSRKRDRQVDGYIIYLSQVYDIPVSACPIPVWNSVK